MPAHFALSPQPPLPPDPGTYALLLELPRPVCRRVGQLGAVAFDAPVYLYAGSAFGPGGLAARLRHHLGRARRPHWHIDFLRSAARPSEVWTTRDPRRLECAWFRAALALRGARAVPGFGASDCACPSHLVTLPRLPSRDRFRRQLSARVSGCRPVARHRL